MSADRPNGHGVKLRIAVSDDALETTFAEASEYFKRESASRGFQAVCERLAPQPANVVAPQALDGFDAFFDLSVGVKASSVEGIGRLAVIARWGVGYDKIDVAALTAADVALAITPNSVRRPVAEATVAMIFALAKGVFLLDRTTRSGKWRFDLPRPVQDVSGKVLGSLGCGNIGRDLVAITRSLGFARTIIHDPYLDPAAAVELGVELVSLEELCSRSDFLCVLTPLTEQTRGIIGKKELAMMKPTAFVINTARGGIIDEAALVEALAKEKIAGAGIDVFEREPPPKDHPYFKLENIILSPHAMAWSDNSVSGNTSEACANIVSLLVDSEPRFIVNREVLERPAFREKLARLRSR